MQVYNPIQYYSIDTMEAYTLVYTTKTKEYIGFIYQENEHAYHTCRPDGTRLKRSPVKSMHSAIKRYTGNHNVYA